MSNYTFTADWSSSWFHEWPTRLASFVGKPGLRFVEVGSYEGRSATWLVDNILTGEDSSIMCIDAWAAHPQHADDDMAAVEARFDRNVAACSRPGAVKKFKERSSFALEQVSHFCPEYVDFAFIDGSHAALDVLIDGALAWRFLKPGGLLVFDDYHWEPHPGTPGGAPKVAIDAFLQVVKGEADVEIGGAQVFVTKGGV